jgi:hypothetical protein
VDAGKGGKYVVLPPDFTDEALDGYIVLPSLTYHGYALLRSILKSGSNADIVEAVDYGKRIKIYPLSTAANPPAMTFVDAINVVYDATIPYDIRFFQTLDCFVQAEPWLIRDKVMIDQLKSIGIEKGKPFAPDTKTKGILNAGVREARALLELTYENAFPPYFTGRRWSLPADPQFIKAAQSGYAEANAYPIDARGLVFTFAFFTPKGETGSFHLMDTRPAFPVPWPLRRGAGFHVLPSPLRLVATDSGWRAGCGPVVSKLTSFTRRASPSHVSIGGRRPTATKPIYRLTRARIMRARVRR